MSYLQDRKTKKRKSLGIFLGILFLLIFFYFSSGIFGGLSYITSFVFHPLQVAGNNIGHRLQNIEGFFISKNTLLKENEDLKQALALKDAFISKYNILLGENIQLKEILGRKNETRPNGSSGRDINIILSAILAKPNQSPYDTLIIDVGKNENIAAGDLVFAYGNVPIGRVSDVYPYSSKVVLFSTAGEKTDVVVEGRDVFVPIAGRGGGNFEIILPRDFTLEKGTTVALPGITPYVVGIVETVISDPRDSFTKALLVSPVNIFELKFVEIQK